MNHADIKVGAVLRVPAGADLTRGQTYYCRVDRIEHVGDQNHPYMHAFASVMRADGRLTRRWIRREDRYRPVTVYIVVNMNQISEHKPTGEIR